MKKTKQIETWQGDFGCDYTKRNVFESDEEFNAVFVKRFGHSRDDLNRDFIGHLDRNILILEVGANVGNQLRALRRIGFHHLYGIEIQRYCVDQAHYLNPEVDVIQGSAFDLPFKDGYFDLVFTNNVLIHISPNDIGQALTEMYRVSKKYIYGAEYYASEFTEIPYRGRTELLWKANYAALLTERFPDLVVEKEKCIPYLDEPNIEDKMYLISKST